MITITHDPKHLKSIQKERNKSIQKPPKLIYKLYAQGYARPKPRQIHSNQCRIDSNATQMVLETLCSRLRMPQATSSPFKNQVESVQKPPKLTYKPDVQVYAR